MSLCALVYFPPSYLLIILGRERDREIEVDVCFGTRRDVSLFAALSCASIQLLNIPFPCDSKLSLALKGCMDLPGQISTYL